ncbi:hypothetical protein [Tenacibaculum crassostreae]|uniref:hypothetical protein n=1 Tax=Tenacibaculum crassostreae TaxID=502683 RepID=UPI0038939B6C
MSTNKIDKHIADKLKNRELSPSPSAWERLSSQLDEHQNKKKTNWFLYFGYAAGVALLLSIGFRFFTASEPEIPSEIIVETPIDTMKMKDIKIEELLTNTEEAIVQVEELKDETKTIKKENFSPTNKSVKVKLKEERSEEIVAVKSILDEKSPKETVISSVDKKSIEAIKNTNSKIKVNSNDLLFAVTHNSEEIKEYYAKHKVKREDVLRTIESELKKSEFKIDPNVILAEVERTIDDEEYKGDFMQKLKLKISGIAVAFVERNK